MDTPFLGRKPAASYALFRPLCRAYALAYISTAGPPLVGAFINFSDRKTTLQQKVEELRRIFMGAIGLYNFPTFCGVLVGGYTVLKLMITICVTAVVNSIRRKSTLPNRVQTLCVRFVAAFLASWCSLSLLNSKRKPHLVTAMPVSDIETSFSSFQNESRDINEDNDHHSDTKLLGKTLDLTLLSTTRGLDAAIRCFRSPFAKANAQPNVPCRHGTSLSRLADSAIFVVSAGTVMWSWFYHPDRLPKAYNEWIGEAAHVDARLVETLRQARRGDFVYAKSRDKNTLLVEMCKEYGWPLQWGDPSKTVPIPCEMVHMGVGPSCHWHAVTRFIRSFQFALATYLPLQLVVKARNPSMKAVQAALKEAIRSSAFLGTFISLFYYSVCLARTLLGPKIFSRDFVSPIMWDKGLCVGVGCVICGWSILIETENRKQEMAFFVAPRAAATFLPRLYNERYFYLEQLAFSTSTAILFALAEDKPEKVRGVLGQLLHRVLDTA